MVICGVPGWFKEPETVYIAMKCLKRGDLTKHIGSPLQQETVQDISEQTPKGLKVMHRRRIARRGVKPSVCLLPPNTSIDYTAPQKYWHIRTVFCSLDVSCLGRIGGTRNIEVGSGLSCYLLLLGVSQVQHSRGSKVDSNCEI